MFIVDSVKDRSAMSQQGNINGVGHGDQIPQTPRREAYVEGNLKMCAIMECKGEVMSTRFSPDGSLIAAGLADGTIKIFNPDTGQCLFALADDDTRQSRLPVTSLRFQPTEDTRIEHQHVLMATYASGMIKFWHYTSGNCMQTLNEERQILASTFNPHGSAFITAGADSAIHMYDAETKRRLRTLEPSDSRDVMNGHRARVFALQYHPFESHLFVSGGWDDTVQFWDDRKKRAIRMLSGPHICGDGIDIDPTHNHILTGSWRKDSVLQIWDFPSGEKIKDVPQDSMHGSQLYCCQWLGKDNIVCGGCEQNMARVIDRGTLNTVGQLVELPKGVYCLDNDRQGSKPRIAVGAAQRVYVLKTEKKQ